jgi:hypothetical protein
MMSVRDFIMRCIAEAILDEEAARRVAQDAISEHGARDVEGSRRSSSKECWACEMIACGTEPRCRHTCKKVER